MRDIAHRGGNAHAHKTKLGSEKSGSNAEIDGGWQEGSQDPEAEGGRHESRENEKAPARKAVAPKKLRAAAAEAPPAVAETPDIIKD